MSGIRYVVGDATAPEGTGRKVIVHVCNDIGGWGAGFVLALSARWPEPEEAYRRWWEQGAAAGFELGALQMVAVDDEVWVANLVGQRDVVAIDGLAPVRYEAIEAGLAELADEVDVIDATVHMPRIGCGLAGGTWAAMEPIIERTLVDRGIEVVVYDLPS